MTITTERMNTVVREFSRKHNVRLSLVLVDSDMRGYRGVIDGKLVDVAFYNSSEIAVIR